MGGIAATSMLNNSLLQGFGERLVTRNTANCVLKVVKTAKSLKQLTTTEVIELLKPEAREPCWVQYFMCLLEARVGLNEDAAV